MAKWGLSRAAAPIDVEVPNDGVSGAGRSDRPANLDTWGVASRMAARAALDACYELGSKHPGRSARPPRSRTPEP